uniref:Uncharacterized protein n=1 Tax=Cacopsylla melanoneura TaxID=428564 RepID=A0A8D8SDC4_9HEMI
MGTPCRVTLLNWLMPRPRVVVTKFKIGTQLPMSLTLISSAVNVSTKRVMLKWALLRSLSTPVWIVLWVYSMLIAIVPISKNKDSIHASVDCTMGIQYANCKCANFQE